MITLVDNERAGGTWLQLGQDVGASGASSARFLGKLGLHALFVATVVILALASDGAQIPWAVMYGPLLAVLGLTLTWFVVDLVCRAPHLEERALFTLSFAVFVLIIGTTSGAMAALVARGVRIVEYDSVLADIPSMDLTSGSLMRQWSGAKLGADDTSAFVQLAEGDPFAVTNTNMKTWIGLNISHAAIQPVYNVSRVKERCFAERSDGVSRLCALDEASENKIESNGSATAQFCSIADLIDAPFEQTCRSVADARCSLYVRPTTFYDSSDDRALANRIDSGIQDLGEGALCSNTCRYNGDRECDDSGPRALYSVCSFGTDCQDCGTRTWHMQGFAKSIYFPTCGYFEDSDASTGIESGFPQRYTAPWANGQRAVCQQPCAASQLAALEEACDLDSSTRCQASTNDGTAFLAYATYREDAADNMTWCCDATTSDETETDTFAIVEALRVEKTRALISVQDCFQACLVQYYYDQGACSLVQFDAESGRCERVDPRGTRLCKRTSSGDLDCSASLALVQAPKASSASSASARTRSGSALENQLSFPVGAPLSAEVALSTANVEDPWNRLQVAPLPGVWTHANATWTMHVMLAQGFAGDTPSSIALNMDMQVVLAPFLCIPLVLALLAICVCCTPINCLPDVRVTDEDVCAWDYVCFKGPAYVHAQAHNFRLLTMALILSLSAVYLLFRKLVFGRADPSAPSWAAVLVPFWIVSALVLASFASLLVTARLVLASSCGSYTQRARLGLHSNSYQASSPRGRFLLCAFWISLVLLVPAVLSLILLSVRLEQNAQLESSSEERLHFVLRVDAFSTTIPFQLGLLINMAGFLVYSLTALCIRLYEWKMTRLEALELSVRAKLRLDRAKQIAHLKDRFLEPQRTSQELIEILQLFVFRGRDCAVSHEEVRNLGHAKLALLEASGQDLAQTWTPEVAREYGELLRFLLSSASDWPQQTCGDSADRTLGPSKRLCLRDLGFSTVTGWAALVLRPASIQRRMLAHLEDEAAAATENSQGFLKFLSTKRRVANAFSARLDANEQPNEEQLLGIDSASSSGHNDDAEEEREEEHIHVQLAVV
ncbi:Hypothetical Protein FCC1311_004012 [Hondaea fermentalgiana]|uniref:Uncharacterized protein n=1 Tax=Hondaea fermentalgiana TaxID=2315210 RepID=A0A2R5G6V5_9STRA|nr:Hypothetical Protein FCC1311_004012 [Hondaea fermentalgiana]|eukprot:GBG24183.1 Hypothetical Protein FCC1311_004012 [Hondaea fermentalgiana]